MNREHATHESVIIDIWGKHDWLWQFLIGAGAKSSPREFWERALLPYFDPKRRYHDWRHIAEGLQEIWGVGGNMADPACIGYAWMFHDYVYVVGSDENEQRSAEIAFAFGRELGLPVSFLGRAAAMILATKGHRSDDPDTQILLSVDLVRLAAFHHDFIRHERDLYREFSERYSMEEFRIGRAAWVRKFLEDHADAIYPHPAFEEWYGKLARRNLRKALRRLS